MLPNNVILKKESLEINNMYVKTFLISDFPENAVPGMLYIITHGEHTGPGIIINYSFHARPAALKFDWEMKVKLRRLKRNIESQQIGDVANEARSEEVKSLDSLLYLRNKSSRRYADVWLSVTISTDNSTLFKKSIDR